MKPQSLTQNLIKAIGIRNHKGMLVEFLHDGRVKWNGKIFENLKLLDEYLSTIKFNVV